MNRIYKILIADPIGMQFDENGQPDHSETQVYIESKGGVFHTGPLQNEATLTPDKLHFFYLPLLSTEQEILAVTDKGQYDALITAATFIPEQSIFQFGGVRIGAGTGNMGSASWGGGSGLGGSAPLMNTPSFNSRATAQMVFKALLKVLPDIDAAAIHQRVVNRDFDTGKHLVQYPTTKLEGKRIAILGYGNIGREVAKLAKAFAMEVVIYARTKHQEWILSEGFEYADSVIAAATGADVLSPHLGLGANGGNIGTIDKSVLAVMNQNSVLINYDRGELVDCRALDWALQTGQVRHAAIDADIFRDEVTGEVSGPMAPYIDIYPNHPDKLSLLPHAAADTEHHSRVAGAKQAVDQIFDVITNRKVINLVGDLPSGYHNGGPCRVKGIGKVTCTDIADVPQDERSQIVQLAGEIAEFWQGQNGDATSATLAANKLFSLMQSRGLLGPYE